MNQKEIDVYKQEIEELTEMLNTEWTDVKEILDSAGISTGGGKLISFYEDEEGSHHGVLFTSEKEIIKFEIKDEEISTQEVKDVTSIQREYPQIVVALRY